MRALYGSAWPFPKNGTGQPRSADDHDLLHKTVPRSCVEAFLRLRHAALLDSVPRGPAHAPILRGTEPAHQELKEILHSLPMPMTVTRQGSHRSDRPGEATWLDGHHRVQEHGEAGGLLPGRSKEPPRQPRAEASDGTNHSPRWLRRTHT